MAYKSESVIFDGEKVVVREETIEDPVGDEIILRAEWSQVSMGTERAFIKKAEQEKKEISLGYSFVGIVEQKGKKANIEVGTRVLALANHASYVKVRAIPDIIVKVPENVPPDIATVGILGSVAFHIIERANIKLAESVGILGQGVVGSLCMQIAKICGARPVIAIDVDDKKLEIAKKYGADFCINSEKENIKKIISDITNGEMLNVIIEAAGTASPINMAKQLLGMWARLIFSSCAYENVCFSVQDDIIDNEITIIGALQPKCPVEKVPYYPFYQIKNRTLAMEFLRDGILKVEKLISHRIKKEQIPMIYSELIRKNKNISGILIDWR